MTREEAINIVRNIYQTDKEKEALATLIPELAESEDERIRKELVEAFEALDIDSSWNGIPVKSILAWLKDQKPVSNPKWTELTWEDINYLEDLMAKVHYEFRNGIGAESFGKEVLEKFREYKEDEDTDEKEQRGKIERAPQGDVVTMLLSDTNTSKSDSILSGRADQKPYEPKNWPADKENLSQGQKPAEWSKNDTVFLNEITDFFENKTIRLQHDIDMYAHWLKSLPDRFNLQPKQEWSEEDERMIGRIRSVVNECASYNDALDVNGDYCEGDYAKLDAWLKSLPERKNLPPKQEWDKEDEIMLKWIEDILLIADGDLSDKLNGRVSPITDSAYSSMKLCIAKCLSWLKSLKPSWKPSEEQMKALLNAEGFLRAGLQHDSAKTIAGLYEQLKKLM